MSWKVLLTARVFDTVGQEALALLRKAGCQLVIPEKAGPCSEEELLRLLPGIDAALCSPDKYSVRVLQSSEASQLKVISRWGVGYDSIDLAEASRQGIVVAYTPGMLNETVADWTWALLLGIARRIHLGHESVKQGEWSRFWGHDIHGKTLGLVGCGRIGQAVAKRARGFDMRVIGYDIAPTQGCGIDFVPFEELLSQSDFISLHAALSPQSRGLMGEAQLKQMKRSAYLINTARGPLINEAALARALHEGWIAGAALDVFSTEPLPLDNPLRSAPNLLHTPHLASFALETADRVSTAAAEAIIEAMSGRAPRWVADPSVWKSPRLRLQLK